MERFYSTADMLGQYERGGWTRAGTPRGFTLTPPEEIATGHVSVWGDPGTHCFIDSDVTFHRDLMERYYYTERSFQITFVEDMTLTYYQSRSEARDARFGVYCHVNNRPAPWYKRFPAGAAQRCSSVVVTESFFSRAGIPMPDDVWDRAALAVNRRELSLPLLAEVCRDIRHAAVGDECFSLYFHGKTAEAVSLLLDHAFSLGVGKAHALAGRSLAAAREALQILNESYVNPPVIEALSRTVGIDKKTLQQAVQQLTGRTVNRYVRSLRMERALSLLTEGTLRIEEVARAVGYHSKINFYKAFADTFGCTPNEMRQGK